MHIADSTVLITGANGGLGHAIARALAAKGAKLVLSGRRPEALRPLAEELSARTVIADLADPAEVDRLAAEAGDVDILVANAALPASGELLEYEPEQIDRALTVNLRAPIFLARRLAPAMVRSGRGHIVMVGSLSGKAATRAAALYNATKFGLRGFTHALRQDLHGTGVGVSLVQPGFVRDAGMFADSGAEAPGNARTVTPERVAKATVRVIERDVAEVDVAPFELRVGSSLALVFPALAARIQRGVVNSDAMRQLVEGQRAKR
jgi:short-subunit dehydrogenase